jgi:hypothetical protein
MSDQVNFQVGLAGLSLGAFGGLADALTVCAKTYGLWKSLRGLHGYLGLLRTKLILQEALLDQWQRDWLDVRHRDDSIWRSSEFFYATKTQCLPLS